MNSNKSIVQLTVFFDGACHLCSREIEHYRRKDAEHRISFTDISDTHFDATGAGLDPVAIQKVMHVRTAAGDLRTGVDAFIEIWKTLPGFMPLAVIAQSRWVRPFLNIGYHAFAAIRPFLPKRKQELCETGTCNRV